MEGHNPLFAMGVEPDYKNPEINLLGLSQGGLSMPDRSFYLEKENEALKADFEASVARLLVLSGVPADAAAKQAKDVVAFETRLATVALPRAELRDAEKTYHPKNLKDLAALTPGLDWKALLGAMGYADVDKFNVGTPTFFTELAKILKESKPDVVKAYLRHHVLVNNAPLLTPELDQAHFEFYGKKLTGQQAQRDRWKRCVGAVEDALGEELGKVYVQRAFAGDSKAVALDMIQRVEKEFEASLPELTWMDEATRKVAVVKAQAITNKIGYPDKWRDYSGLSVDGADYYGNVVRGRAAFAKFWMDQAGKPVDKTIWYMNPQEVNAYYNPLANEIAFPAGILQPPFFSSSYPRAMNYGAMGMVMGHEISHGFDDSGRKFDASGRLVEWWAPEVAARFEERAACVEKQYSGYEVAPDLFVDGKLTLGENIADLGGLKQSYRAYKKWEKEQSAPEATVAGLTPDQLYFVAYAQAWCTVATPEWEKVQVKSDPHSPARFRVNGPVRNLPEFARAFQCEQGQPLYPKPDDVCIVW
jgi:predicted metalloendopeptidase